MSAACQNAGPKTKIKAPCFDAGKLQQALQERLENGFANCQTRSKVSPAAARYANGSQSIGQGSILVEAAPHVPSAEPGQKPKRSI